jgi:hypothetical protein
LDFSKAVPNQLSYQGFLVNASDSSIVNATLEMTFRLFDSETKGAELWAETHPMVTVSNGLFQVLLGSVTSFPVGIFDATELWLQTEVGVETLSPRKLLVSVAYSQHAQTADHAMTADWAGDAEHALHADTAAYSPMAGAWTIDGDDVYREIGRVGIGTTTPLTELDVSGSVSATTYYGDGSNLTGIVGTPDDDWTISGDTIYHEVGNVGIGTTSPGYPLDVNGSVSATTYYGDGSNLTGIAGTPDADWTVAGSHMYSAVPGSVGIGTSIPEKKFHVAGDVKATTYYGDGSNLTGISGTTDNDWTIDGADVYHETGNVGIGTAIPTAPLTIQTTTGTDVQFSSSGSNADIVAPVQFNIGTSNIQGLHLMTGGSTRMCVTGTGQVGIGTTSPSQQLDVTGAVNATTYYGDGSNLTGISSTPDGDWTISGDHVYHETGNVGIGTTDPILGRLEAVGFTCPGVYGASDSYAGVLGSSSNAQGVLGVSTSGHAGYFLGDVYIHGNTGIGAESPVAKLDVNGDINADSLYKLAGSTVLSAEGYENLFVGVGAGSNASSFYATCVGDSAGVHDEGYYNTFVGRQSGYHNTTGSNNTFMGTASGAFNTDGDDNTFIGISAGVGNQVGYENVFVGSNAGAKNVSGNKNTVVGNDAGYENTGSDNTFLGDHAGYLNTSGHHNVFVGRSAGSINGSGNYNTYLGTDAGKSNAAGIHNVFIGFQAGYYCEGDSNKLYIANGANDSNVLIYGDFSTGRIGLGTLAPAERLHLHEDSGSLGMRIQSDVASYQYINLGATNGYGLGCDSGDNFFLNREEPLGTGTLRIMTALPDGSIGIGVSNPTYRLHLPNNANESGRGRANQWTTYSSREEKRDITALGPKDYTAVLEEIAEMDLVYYRYKNQEDDRLYLGVIAEDAPLQVVTSDRKGISLSEFTAFAMAGLKAQQEYIEEQLGRIDTLEKEIAVLKSQLQGRR